MYLLLRLLLKTEQVASLSFFNPATAPARASYVFASKQGTRPHSVARFALVQVAITAQAASHIGFVFVFVYPRGIGHVA